MPDWAVERRFPRYRIQLPLLHKPKLVSAERAGVGWTRDLSQTGVCVELAERFQPEMLLQIRLQTDRGPIEVEAQVVWAGERPPTGGGLRHGLAFTQILPDQQEALRELIRSKGEVRQAGVRLPLDLPVTCQPKGPAAPPLQGRTGDISRGGLLLHLPHLLAPGTELEITLQTAHGALSAGGAVVWAEGPPGRGPDEPVRHGLRFTAMGWSSELFLGLSLVDPG